MKDKVAIKAPNKRVIRTLKETHRNEKCRLIR
jgi:hypothetical protein